MIGDYIMLESTLLKLYNCIRCACRRQSIITNCRSIKTRIFFFRSDLVKDNPKMFVKLKHLNKCCNISKTSMLNIEIIINIHIVREHSILVKEKINQSDLNPRLMISSSN